MTLASPQMWSWLHPYSARPLASSPSAVGFITRDLHPLLSRIDSQTNRCGFYLVSLTSKLCVGKESTLQMSYLPHKPCCPDLVASAAAISDEANCISLPVNVAAYGVRTYLTVCIFIGNLPQTADICRCTSEDQGPDSI